MPDDSKKIHIIGYSNKLSVRPRESVEFKISSHSGDKFQTRLTRLISADPNPNGMGIVETNCDEWYQPQKFNSRVQPFFPGSYAVSDMPIEMPAGTNLTLSANVFATLAKSCEQTILSVCAVSLGINDQGFVFIRCGGQRVISDERLPLRQWMRLEVEFDFSTGGIVISQWAIDEMDDSCKFATKANINVPLEFKVERFCVAAMLENEIAKNHFNGKIESPLIQWSDTSGEQHVLIAWDFSHDITSIKVHDAGPNHCHGSLVNFPVRAVTGSNWSGKEMCWRHATDEYRAIHFHDDDIYDFGWQTDFCFDVPTEMPSGIYVMYIEADGEQDGLPFFVCAPQGKPSAKVCVIIPTFTYVAYGNHARPEYHPSWQEKIKQWGGYPHNPANHREYGLSTYNFHSDGSGIAHASHLRPLFNLRPGYITFGSGEDSGLRHLQADSHLISWLHAKEIEYDIITDKILHDEGFSAIQKYSAVLTSSHPEYHTYETLNAIKKYTHNNGRLLYLGGNGFYWRIAVHAENEEVIEIRRAEGGIRAWAAETGEYYSAFDGLYGGLWRRIGRPPQQLVGIGFTAQGNFTGSYYRRKCFEPEYDWVFDGVKFDGVKGDIIGDFGFSGGGAAGFELDRIDERFGAPLNIVVLASSEGHNKDFILVPEEQLTHLTNLSGQAEEKLLRADMIYFTLPGGGSVFAVGSITFCGSLPCNNFDNSISGLLENVVSMACAE